MRWKHTEREKSHEEYLAQAMLLGMNYVEWLNAYISGDGEYIDADTMKPLSSLDVRNAIMEGMKEEGY